MDYILDNLAIGNAREASQPASSISALLCVAQEIEIPSTSLIYYKVPIIDMQPIPEQQLEEAVEWIHHHIQNYKILVFCSAGVGRSTSIVVGYLCTMLGFKFGTAVEFIAQKRPYMSILPNLIVSIDRVKQRRGDVDLA